MLNALAKTVSCLLFVLFGLAVTTVLLPSTVVVLSCSTLLSKGASAFHYCYSKLPSWSESILAVRGQRLGSAKV